MIATHREDDGNLIEVQVKIGDGELLEGHLVGGQEQSCRKVSTRVKIQLDRHAHARTHDDSSLWIRVIPRKVASRLDDFVRLIEGVHEQARVELPNLARGHGVAGNDTVGISSATLHGAKEVRIRLGRRRDDFAGGQHNFERLEAVYGETVLAGEERQPSAQP